MTQDLQKICPNCHQKDVTSFSTCKSCGTRYDAIVPKQKNNIDERFMLSICVITLVVGGILWFVQAQKAAKLAHLASTRESIIAANRPRVIEFYATWCGPCQAYGPIVEQCRTKYAGKIDFQRLDIDDPINIQSRQALSIHAVPTTFIFNRKGEEVTEFSGGIDFSTLDQYLQNPELVK